MLSSYLLQFFKKKSHNVLSYIYNFVLDHTFIAILCCMWPKSHGLDKTGGEIFSAFQNQYKTSLFKENDVLEILEGAII